MSWNVCEKNPKAKLTKENLFEINELFKAGISKSEIGRKFNVHRSTIDRAIKRYKYYQA